MQKILILGAGHSAPYLIRHLLDRATALDLQITVGDLDVQAAHRRVRGHDRGRAIAFDLADSEACAREFSDTTVVVSLLPPPLQPRVARHCLEHGAHMVSASYRSPAMAKLDGEAKEQGLLFLCELGLDPGIDLMSAQQLIEDVHGRGGVVEHFASYGAGIPEPSFEGNPLRYCVTWNPRNVAMAGESGACYLQDGRMRLVPYPRLFESSWTVDVPGLGIMDAYANRDSLSYRDIHGLARRSVRTLIRGTLRYPGYCHTWQAIVRLGLPNEHLQIPRLGQRSYGELVSMCLPDGIPGEVVAERAANYLGMQMDDPAIQNLEALGLFSDTLIDVPGERPVDALIALLERRLPLPSGVRDMVLLHHELEVNYPERGERERILSTLTHFGDPDGITAMARGVGLPAALGVELILSGDLERRGVVIPVTDDIYEPILNGLAQRGLKFEEQVQSMPDSGV